MNQHSTFEDCQLKDFQDENGFIYLFGYGSLLWNVDFEYETKFYGFVENYERKFWLCSDDHRGTPENLGRVLTLVHSDKKRVHGIAYKIGKNVEEAFERLNFREKCGYSIKKLVFYKGHDDKSESLDCICYFANEDNPYFKPEEDLNRLAVQIYESVGPSGTNKEYLYKFCDALRNTVTDENELKNDLEIFSLEKLVRSLEN